MNFKLQKLNIVLSSVVKWYLLFMGDYSTIRQLFLKRLLTLGLLTFQFTLAAETICIFSKPFIFTLSDLVNKMHGVIMFIAQILCFIWWRNRTLLREVVLELTDIMTCSQVPVESKVRRELMTQCQFRHSLILWVYSGMSFIVSAMYTFPPIISFLIDSLPDKKLNLPLGMCYPFSCNGGGGEGLFRGFAYLLFSICFFGLNYVTFHGAVIYIILLDSLKTLFHLSSLAFLRLGDASEHPDHLLSAIQFHQRLFRLSSKVKKLVEPVLAIGVFSIAIYDVIGGLAVTTQRVSSEFYIFIEGMVGLMGPIYVIFSLPASVTRKSEEIASSIYFNKNWVARRFKYAAFFPFIIMRANNQRVKFRIFNCWVLSMEHFIQYLKLLYSFFMILRSVTLRSQKDIVMTP